MFVREEAVSEYEEYVLKEENEFMMAFAIANKYTGKPYTDPRYVKWYATLGQIDKNGLHDYTGVPMHPCTK